MLCTSNYMDQRAIRASNRSNYIGVSEYSSKQKLTFPGCTSVVSVNYKYYVMYVC